MAYADELTDAERVVNTDDAWVPVEAEGERQQR